MRTDDDIYLTLFQVFEHLCGLFGTLGSREIIHPDGHILQTRGERTEVLIGQHRGGNQHSYLFTIAGRLESSAHSHLCLAETHIATDQAVHRTGTLHILLHIERSLQLVRRILVNETGLELMLQIRVGAEGKALLTAALGIKLDQVAGNILDMFLGALFEFLPLAGTEGRETGRFAIVLRFIFRHLIERVDRHIDAAATVVENLDHLLITIPLGHAHKPAELTHTMIDMHHEVANLKLLDFLQRKCHLTTTGFVALEVILMETVEYLVVGEDADAQVIVGKALVEGPFHRSEE